MKTIRLLEIDATPIRIPSEVEKLMEPFLKLNHSNDFDMKAGELYDADSPQTHSSYYIAARFDSDPVSTKLASEFLKGVTHRANSLRLPIVEIKPGHIEFENLIAEFGW